MKKYDYYIKQQEAMQEELYKQEDLVENIDSLKKELLNKIANVILYYKVTDEYLDLKQGEITKIYTLLSSLINKEVTNNKNNNKKIISNILNNTVKDKYYGNEYLINSNFKINFKLKKLTNKEFEKIVNSKINNLNWSSRWDNNKDQISKLLKQKSLEFLKGETSVNQISNEISKIFKTDKFVTNRLVQDQIARCSAEANELVFKNKNIELVYYSATLDTKTCNDCSVYDNKEYAVEDTTRPKLKRHIGCRCTYIAIPRAGYRSIGRRDNEKEEIIDFTDYENWKKNNNI